MINPKFRAWSKFHGRMFYQNGCTISEIVNASNECVDEFWFDEKQDIWMLNTAYQDDTVRGIFEGFDFPPVTD